MSLEWNFPPIQDTGGGGGTLGIDGSYTGATLPAYMDPQGLHGEIVVLKMESAIETGRLPDHPFLIRSSIENWINGEIDGAIPEAKGKTYALKVRSKKQLDRLLAMNRLDDGTMIKITKHANLNSVRCVINCPSMINVPDEDVLSYLKNQRVTQIRRITRKSKTGTEKENTATVILTIDGTRMPEHVDVGYLRCRTRPYYPAPMLCFQCFAFGHTSKKCQQKEQTCGQCAKTHIIMKGERCSAAPFCPRCNTNSHSISSRNCPVYKTEDAIQRIRVDKGITYPAAKRIFEVATGAKSFAGVINMSKDQAFKDLSAKYDQLSNQMEEKDRKIAALEETLKQRPTTSNNTEFGELRQMIVDLQMEVRRKDERIQALEAALHSDNRMDITRKHGTIEDLVAKVKSLEVAVSNKDKEVANLRLVNQQYKDLINQANSQSKSTKSSKATGNLLKKPSFKPSKQQQKQTPTQHQQPEKLTGTKKKVPANGEADSKRPKTQHSQAYISDTEIETSPPEKEITGDGTISSEDEAMSVGSQTQT